MYFPHKFFKKMSLRSDGAFHMGQKTFKISNCVFKNNFGN